MRKLSFFFLLGMISIYADSQELDEQSKHKISIDTYVSNKANHSYYNPLYIQGNYFIGPKFSTGIYFSYHQNIDMVSFTEFSEFNECISGILSRYYVLKRSSRIQPYVAGKIGIKYLISKSEYLGVHKNRQFDYGVYGGVAVKAYKGLHVLGEIGYAEFDLFRLGIRIDL